MNNEVTVTEVYCAHTGLLQCCQSQQNVRWLVHAIITGGKIVSEQLTASFVEVTESTHCQSV